MAKQYTEGLGRAPDALGWTAAVRSAVQTGCSASSLQAQTMNLFQSTEYTSKGYIPEEQVLTVYRAVLSREPDSTGFNFWVNSLKSGHALTEMIQAIMTSQEFTSLMPAICAGNGYDPIGAPTRPLDIGSGSWTQAQLESCINSNAVCSVPPRVVVYLTSTLNIPAGKVLETAGGYTRTMYARQARIVRDAPAQGILILMQPGSTVRDIWVSGGRDRFKSSLIKMSTPQANVFPNINYVGGNYGTIEGVRSDAPLSATHIATFPVPTPAIPTAPTAFNGTVYISNNLTTGYAQRHYDDGTPIPWADGISSHIMGATIRNNDIVDPTDVGIVIFGHDGANQQSTASGNIIVHSGHSAYGSLGLDTTQCTASLPSACAFSGSGFSYNLIFAGPNQHSDIVLFNGTGAWVDPHCDTANNGNCGSGGQMSHNSTITDSNNHLVQDQMVQVQAGIVVDGMLNAVTDLNNLNAIQMTVPPDNTAAFLACNTGTMIRNDLKSGHASGTLQGPATDTPSHGCIGHRPR